MHGFRAVLAASVIAYDFDAAVSLIQAGRATEN
jgi:hypothetical protein